jgi:hypothetical protein
MRRLRLRNIKKTAYLFITVHLLPSRMSMNPCRRLRRCQNLQRRGDIDFKGRQLLSDRLGFLGYALESGSGNGREISR